jgi:mannose-P-dolichol utilization defect protein 1
MIFFTETCYDIFFTEFDFLNVPCITKLLNKVLSVGIVVLSIILKVPQIIKIVTNKSTFGLSFQGIFMECLLYTFNAAYNVNEGRDFMLYGENFFILFQNLIILFLFTKYDTQTTVTKIA